MFKKPSRKVFRVFLHHSATDNPEHDTIDFIRRVHVDENGWSAVGYHFFIDKNGVLFQGRSLERSPAAQKGYNKSTIAICLSGRKEFTEEQKKALQRLCNKINEAYGGISFHGHKEVASTLCPAYPYKEWLGLDDSGFIRPQVFNNKAKIIQYGENGKPDFLTWIKQLLAKFRRK